MESGFDRVTPVPLPFALRRFDLQRHLLAYDGRKKSRERCGLANRSASINSLSASRHPERFSSPSMVSVLLPFRARPWPSGPWLLFGFRGRFGRFLRRGSLLGSLALSLRHTGARGPRPAFFLAVSGALRRPPWLRVFRYSDRSFSRLLQAAVAAISTLITSRPATVKRILAVESAQANRWRSARRGCAEQVTWKWPGGRKETREQERGGDPGTAGQRAALRRPPESPISRRERFLSLAQRSGFRRRLPEGQTHRGRTVHRAAASPDQRRRLDSGQDHAGSGDAPGTRVRAADSILDHSAEAMETEEIVARISALEQAAEDAKGHEK